MITPSSLVHPEHQTVSPFVSSTTRNSRNARRKPTPLNSNSSQLANQILGVRQNDYMSGLNDLSTAIDAFVEQAQNATADVALSPVTISKQTLIANVMVTNKTGHRLRTGQR